MGHHIASRHIFAHVSIYSVCVQRGLLLCSYKTLHPTFLNLCVSTLRLGLGILDQLRQFVTVSMGYDTLIWHPRYVGSIKNSLSTTNTLTPEITLHKKLHHINDYNSQGNTNTNLQATSLLYFFTPYFTPSYLQKQRRAQFTNSPARHTITNKFKHAYKVADNTTLVLHRTTWLE